MIIRDKKCDDSIILTVYNPYQRKVKDAFTKIVMREHKYITTKLISWEFNNAFHVKSTNKSFTKTVAEFKKEGLLLPYRTNLYISTLFENEEIREVES